MAGSFAVPTIGALPQANPALTELGQFATAVGNAPEDMRTANLQKQQDQLLGTTMEEQQAELGTKGLQRLVQAGLSNPQISRDPQYGQHLESFAKMAGTPIARNSDGSYNLQAMIPKTEIPAEVETRLASLDPASRQAILTQHPEWTFSPGFANMPAVLTQGDKNDAWRAFDSVMAKVADPKGGGIEALQAFADTAAGKALFPSLKDIANNPQFQQAISARADAFVNDQRYKDVIHPGEMADIARKRIELETKRLTMSEADKARELRDREQQYATKAAEWQRTFGQREKDFGLAEARLKAATAAQSATAQYRYATELRAAVTSMQTGVDSLNTNIRSYVTGGQDAPDALVAQRDALQKRLDDARAAADVASEAGAAGVNTQVRVQAGAANAQVVGGTLGSPVATDRTGRLVYQSNGAYVYADGTPYKP